MANMSYCRFSNTLSDLQDCYRVMDENPKLDEEEEKAAKKLIRLCRQIADDYGE